MNVLEDNTLFGIRDKEREAIERLKQHCPKDKPYWLAFSGGKDSICIYKLAELAGVSFEAHYNDTTVDPPELKRFIKQHYPQVQIDRPEKSMFQLIIKKGPPMRNRRWCCQTLKERNPENRVVITGIRHEESARRKSREMFEKSTQTKGTFFLHPIIDWTELDVWNFIEKHNLPYCSLYEEFDRIGCILCPMVRDIETQREKWPKMFNAYKRAFRKFWDRKEKERNNKRWGTFEEFWGWWLDRDAKTKDLNQQEMF